MLEKWQFNVLFFVGVGGAVLLLLGPEIGLDQISDNPTALSGIAAILTYVLTQRKALTKDDDKKPDKTEERKEEGDGLG